MGQTDDIEQPSTASVVRLLSKANPTRGELLRMVVWFSVPAILAEVSNTAMGYIDTAMVGSLGAAASAAVGLVASSTWLLNGLTTGAATGFTVQIAQLVGAGREADARNVLRQALLVLLAFSAALALVGALVSGPLPAWLGGEPEVLADASGYFLVYALALPAVQVNRLCVGALQCSGNMRTPSALNVLMCLLDVVFNFFLIFPTRTATLFGSSVTLPGAGLGVVGAALGTAFAEVVVAALLLWVTCVRSPQLALFGALARTRIQTGAGAPAKNRTEARPKIAGQTARGASSTVETWRPQRRCLLAATRVAAPICLERIVMSAAQIVSTAIVAPLGTVAVAAHALAITAEGVCYMPGYGIGTAATTLVGQSFGANRKDLARRSARMSVALGMVVMGLTGALMFWLAPAVFRLLTPDVAVQELGATSLRIELLAEPLFAAAIVAMGALRGAGDTLVPSIMNLATMWGVRITLAVLLTPHLGLSGVWIAMAIELCVRGTLFLVRLLRGRWLERGSLAG